MLEDMKNGKPFDIEYVTVNRKKGTGGAQKTLEQAVLASDHFLSLELKGGGERKKVYGSKTSNPAVKVFYSSRTGDDKSKFRDVWVHLITKYNGRQVI